MLTPTQREAFENGEIRGNETMQLRVRQSLAQTIHDFNLLVRHHSWIEGQQNIEDFVPHGEIRELLGNLLYILDGNHIDEDLLWMLLCSTEDCWSLDDDSHVHGHKQQIALDLLLESFSDWDPEDPMTPDPSRLDGWEELEEMMERVSKPEEDVE